MRHGRPLRLSRALSYQTPGLSIYSATARSCPSQMRAATAPLREIEARWQREDGVALAKYEAAQKCHEAAFKGKLETIKDQGPYLAESSPRSDVPPPPVKPVRRRLTVGDTTMEGLAH